MYFIWDFEGFGGHSAPGSKANGEDQAACLDQDTDASCWKGKLLVAVGFKAITNPLRIILNAIRDSKTLLISISELKYNKDNEFSSLFAGQKGSIHMWKRSAQNVLR